MSDSTFRDLVAFSRGSAATRVNEAGQLVSVPANVPRFDYDRATLDPRGLLLESAGANPDGSNRAPDNTKVTLNADWFNAASGVWLVEFEYPGAGEHTVIELVSDPLVFGIKVIDGDVIGYCGDIRVALDTALPGVVTAVALGFGPNGARVARNGIVGQLSAARVKRVTDVALGETFTAAKQIDARVRLLRYLGSASSESELAALVPGDEWADMTSFLAENYGDFFIPLCAQLDATLNS
jgi:hypothetical protein